MIFTRAIFLSLALTAAAPAAEPPYSPAPSPPTGQCEKEGRPGVVYVIGGVGGAISPLYVSAHWALPRAGVEHELRDFSWTHGTGRILCDLQDLCHLMAKAGELADAVREVKQHDPTTPVYFLAHSGGCGVALAAAGMLPPATVERIVLLSAAVSPTLDLRPALRATRCEIVSFYSALDVLWLGLGARLCGTTDRVYCFAAGHTGFVVPEGLDEESCQLYRRLVQVPWCVEDLCELNIGAHHSTCAPGFLKRHVAPWLRP
jgi:hypothetical protein